MFLPLSLSQTIYVELYRSNPYIPVWAVSIGTIQFNWKIIHCKHCPNVPGYSVETVSFREQGKNNSGRKMKSVTWSEPSFDRDANNPAKPPSPGDSVGLFFLHRLFGGWLMLPLTLSRAACLLDIVHKDKLRPFAHVHRYLPAGYRKR